MPVRLQSIADPPSSLYYRGDIQHIPFEGARWCAIVGSRHPSDYGKISAYKFSYELARRGVIVVSGLAIGTDSYVHRAALEAGGTTVAVMGTAIDHTYPFEHEALARAITKKGLVVSECAPGANTYPRLFSQRNRIISGLSYTIIIIEGTARSGTLVTMRYALAQGRDVAAVPGDITCSTAYAPHMLIQQGATPATCAQDIFDLWA